MGEEEPEDTLGKSIPDVTNLKSTVNMPYHFGSWLAAVVSAMSHQQDW